MGINLNVFAKETTLEEGKVQSMSIAQVKECQRITFKKLAALPESEVIKLLRKYRQKD